MCYRINDTVDFIPADRMLRGCVIAREVMLFAPGAHCLEALINAQGNVVEQRELIRAGWPDEEEHVSLNIFYQSVFNIRKQLHAFLPDQEIITTVKRSGLLISHNVQIRQLRDEARKPEGALVNAAPAEDIVTDNAQRKSIRKGRFFLAVMLPIALLVSSGLYYRHSLEQRPPALFPHYVFYKKLASGCEMYINQDEAGNLTGHPLFAPETFDCQGYPRAYVTQWAMRPRSSVALCRHALSSQGETLQCKTFYYASHAL